MRLAILSDLHLGYGRFEEDSYAQAERAIEDASKKSDAILCAGDIFDVKVPRLETLKRSIEIFRKAKVPIYAIFGNHERRARELVNPVHMLAASGCLTLLHANTAVIEKNDERAQVFGLGSVPEEYAAEALKQALGRFAKDGNAFTILMIHQSIRELVPGGTDELSLEYLDTLGFDLIIDGHIHETMAKLGGRFLIPGSTVVTQLKKEETAPKGYYLYDTNERRAEFVPIRSRPFYYEELKFERAGEGEIRKAVEQKIAGLREKSPDCLIALKIDGTIREGLSATDVKPGQYEGVYIDNRLNIESLGVKLERIRTSREASLSLRELALKELRGKTSGKITLFDASELFERLLEGPDETIAHLQKDNKKGAG